MHRNLRILESVVDRLIPFLVVVLLVLIVLEFTLSEALHPYELYISIFDGFVITIFIIDLGFKYRRVHILPEFFKKYWIDIIAVFPFYLFLRLIERAMQITYAVEIASDAQKIFHEGLEIEHEGARIARELEQGGRMSRTALFHKILQQPFIRAILRTPRLLRAFTFYEKPFLHLLHKNPAPVKH